ncbi:hypothetical protein LAZ67_X004197 [Cordylochernes scorpioides]|uniref:Uncharacterized protein n=1 Tax=Cordylochernes scorpioides TaxID=51811 RepID=A0ABY6LV94_9ARAC|nr:hypothetical protein LAZ67_X004197 [Cordylochernes scorpioides]
MVTKTSNTRNDANSENICFDLIETLVPGKPFESEAILLQAVREWFRELDKRRFAIVLLTVGNNDGSNVACELDEALNHLVPEKTPGPDNITGPILKNLIFLGAPLPCLNSGNMPQLSLSSSQARLRTSQPATDISL